MRRYLLRPWMSALLTLVCCVPLAHGFAIDVFTADGEWCPMAHCNRLDNSFQEIAPLLTVGDVQEISAPNLSPMAHNLLGCVSGPKVAICAYNHPDLPAVAALDPVTGNVLWTSPLEDLPEARQGRNPAGLLLARLGVNGNPPKRYVYTGNAHEFVAYHALTGRRVWKRKTTEITPAADEIGAPVSFSYTDNKELVTVTSYGWVVKLNPVNGETIDAYRMKTAVPIDGRLYGGVFITKNSPAIAGNRMYLTCEFVASPENPLPNPDYPPIYVVRVELGQHEGQQGDNRITPVMTPVSVDVAAPDRVAIGVGNAGGSPSAMVTATGSVLVVADASVAENGGLVPAVVAVEDIAGELKPRWRMVFSDNGDKIIVAAPALYAPSKTLLVNTNQQLYVVRDIDKLSGQVVPPEPLTPSQLLGCVEPGPTESLLTGSPMGVAFSQSTNELIVYTNVRLVDRATEESHGYLVAFAIPAKGPAKARRLWCARLELQPYPEEGKHLGALGQPALFLTEEGDRKLSNLIINTYDSGTFIFRSDGTTAAPGTPEQLYNRILESPAVARFAAAGYSISRGHMIWPNGCPEGDDGCIRFVNNPITRYGMAYLPAGSQGELSTRLHLDGNDAFVLFGQTPDVITYFSHTMNQYDQFHLELNDYFTTASSISLSINHANINSIGGPFNGFFALVVAAKYDVANLVHQSLVQAGIPEAAINRIMVPARFFNKDMEANPDELMFVTRLTHRTAEEEAVVKAYIEQSQSVNKLMFFDSPGGVGDVADSHLPQWEERLRWEPAETESGIETVLDWMVDRIIERYVAQGYTLRGMGTENLQHVNPDVKCRDIPASCNFDAPDALYARFFYSDGRPFIHELPNRKDFFIIAGVDHHRFAKDTLGSYYSYALTRYNDLAGIATLTDLQMDGSASQYLLGTPVDPRNLFAIKISRECGNDTYCMTVPWGSDGIPQYDPFMVTARIYLDQQTGTAPNPENFVPARLLWFVQAE